MAKQSGQRKALSISVTITTRQRMTAARPDAQWSADTIALESRLCVPPRHAVTDFAQALNHATTETP